MAEEAVKKGQPPTKKALENYASAYMGAYLAAVQKERPEHMPSLARNAPFEIEVCYMPNHCFAMLFERASAQKISVSERDWSYVESKVMGGVEHVVVVYAHEGPTVADAIAKGKKDAIRDIRALEDSQVAKAASQLEKILEELTHVEKGNKSVLKLAEVQMKKLDSIKEVVRNAGPEVDMLALIDSIKNYPTVPVEVNIDLKEKELLENIASELGNLSDVIRRVEAQDQKLEEIEQSVKKALSEYERSVNERIGKGMAVVLSSSDRKIDKGLAAIEEAVKGFKDNGYIENLEERVTALEKALEEKGHGHDVSREMVLAIASLRESMDRFAARVTKIEQYLVQISRARPPRTMS